MRVQLALFGLALSAAAASGCEINVGPAQTVQGSGNVKTESRDVRGFDAVEVAGIGTLVVTQGDSEHLTISAEDNILPKLTSDVVNGRLELHPDANAHLDTTQPIRYDLTVKQLKEIRLAGSGDIQASTLNADSLDLAVAGSGNGNIGHLTAKTLNVTIAGSGTLTLAGQAAQQNVHISGSGRYRASDLQSQQAKVDIAGSGDCAVRVSDRFDVIIAGSGNVSYVGSPTVNQTIVGSGRVSKAG
jgi:Putative auto-transporter adhesin, head GIN domain